MHHLKALAQKEAETEQLMMEQPLACRQNMTKPYKTKIQYINAITKSRCDTEFS